jgi:hypothetical protein
MSSRKLLISAFAGVSLCACVPAASSEPLLAENQARYLPIQNISYGFGSKSMSGYFVDQASTCRVTLMITERNDPEQGPLFSATRVRLVLFPGQVAGLDSEEGPSLKFTCSEAAKTLLVTSARGKVVEFQSD